jgi:hypothetical protein
MVENQSQKFYMRAFEIFTFHRVLERGVESSRTCAFKHFNNIAKALGRDKAAPCFLVCVSRASFFEDALGCAVVEIASWRNV